MSPMSHQETGEAMSHQHGRRRTGLHGNIQRTNPILAYRTVPIFEIHALPLGMTQLPERLPMLRPGVANSWQDQNRSVSLHAEPSLVGCAKLLWHARTSMVRMSWTSPVFLVHLVSLMQSNKPDRPNRPNEQDRLAGFFSILQEPVRCCRSSRGEGGTGRCATAGLEKPEAYSPEYVEDFSRPR